MRVAAGEGEWCGTIAGVRQGIIMYPTIRHIHGLGDPRSGHDPRTSQLDTGMCL